MTRLFDLSRSEPIVEPIERKFCIGAILLILLCLALVLIASCSESPNAYAQEIKDTDAIKAIIGEAENQGFDGLLDVACAIRNRGTLKGVYGLKSFRVVHKLYSQGIYREASKAWLESANPAICARVKDAIGWEDTKAFGENYWTRKMKLVLTYKDHNFYAKN